MTLKLIAVTGTPGTGKTTLAKKLSLLLDYTYLDGSQLIKTAKLAEKYDKTRKTAIVDASKFAREVLKVRDLLAKSPKMAQSGLIVDSHLSHFLPSKAVTACLVLTCGLRQLEKRMQKKHFSKSKIRENLDAEIFDIILVEATDNKHKIIKFDTSKPTKKDLIKLAKRLKSV